MGQLLFMAEARMKRQLRTGAARILIDNRDDVVQGIPERYRGVLFWVNVGTAFYPSAPVTLTPEGWSAPLSFDKQPYHTVVPWPATAVVEPYNPPGGGGGGTRVRKAA